MLALFRPCASLPTAAIKFPVQLEKAWLLASVLGFTLDVGVYHTFSLFVRSVMKLLVSGKVDGGKAGRAHCASHAKVSGSLLCLRAHLLVSIRG